MGVLIVASWSIGPYLFGAAIIQGWQLCLPLSHIDRLCVPHTGTISFKKPFQYLLNVLDNKAADSIAPVNARKGTRGLHSCKGTYDCGEVMLLTVLFLCARAANGVTSQLWTCMISYSMHRLEACTLLAGTDIPALLLLLFQAIIRQPGCYGSHCQFQMVAT